MQKLTERQLRPVLLTSGEVTQFPDSAILAQGVVVAKANEGHVFDVKTLPNAVPYVGPGKQKFVLVLDYNEKQELEYSWVSELSLITRPTPLTWNEGGVVFFPGNQYPGFAYLAEASIGTISANSVLPSPGLCFMAVPPNATIPQIVPFVGFLYTPIYFSDSSPAVFNSTGVPLLRATINFYGGPSRTEFVQFFTEGQVQIVNPTGLTIAWNDFASAGSVYSVCLNATGSTSATNCMFNAWAVTVGGEQQIQVVASIPMSMGSGSIAVPVQPVLPNQILVLSLVKIPCGQVLV